VFALGNFTFAYIYYMVEQEILVIEKKEKQAELQGLCFPYEQLTQSQGEKEFLQNWLNSFVVSWYTD
jgi:hypothetical protein